MPTFFSPTVWFYQAEQTAALFDLAFVLSEGGQAETAQSLNTEFICLQITNNKPLRDPSANKRALFLSLLISMLISTHRAFFFQRNVEQPAHQKSGVSPDDGVVLILKGRAAGRVCCKRGDATTR